MRQPLRLSWIPILILVLTVSLLHPVTAERTASHTVVRDHNDPSARTVPKPKDQNTSTSRTTLGTCASASINYVTRLPPSQCWKQPRPTSSTEVVSDSSTNLTDNPSIGLNAVASTPSPNQSHGSSPQEAASATDTSASTVQATVTDHVPGSIVAVDVATATVEVETESPLDNAKFLSFEDWKKQNLPPDAQFHNAAKASNGPSRPRLELENALDGLGEEGEIVINFSGFGGISSSEDGRLVTDEKVARAAITTGSAVEEIATNPKKRRRDAGKTCKERTNYASFDCGATILKTNPEGRNAKSILLENKDSYMLNECSADNKFLIVEMCDEIKIDTVAIANFEFFSSIFRSFRVSVSDRYPVKKDKWKTIGDFEARNTREMQAFLVENHDGFARFIRIEFLTHYGGEYYCPVSLFRVHGVTAFEEYKLEQLAAEGDDQEYEDEQRATAADELGVTGTIEPPAPHTESDPAESLAADQEHEAETLPKMETEMEVDYGVAPNVQNSQPSNFVGIADTNRSDITPLRDLEILFKPKDSEVCRIEDRPEPPEPTNTTREATRASISQMETNGEVRDDSSKPAAPSSVTAGAKSSFPSSSSSSSSSSSLMHVSSSVSVSRTGTAMNSTGAEVPGSAQKPSIDATAGTPSSVRTPSTVSSPSVSSHQSSAPSTTPSNTPPTQESFFKSINKRLQFLEANSTLSLQYIESQSALLREAFAQVEKRQMTKTLTFLEILNTTVSAELSRFQSDYEQLWQSTLMELASQRDEGRRERELLGERVKMLAEEMVNQKRLMAAQATILLLCLGLLVFARFGTVNGSVDVSLAQAMTEIVHRGKQARAEERERNGRSGWHWDSPWNSPSRTSRIGATTPVSISRMDRLGDEDGLESPEKTEQQRQRADSPQQEQHIAQGGFYVDRLPPSDNTASLQHQTVSYLRPGNDGVDRAVTRSAPTTPMGEYQPPVILHEEPG